MMTLPIVHHPDYCADLPTNHRFPMDKFRAVAERIVTEGLLGGGKFLRPRPAPEMGGLWPKSHAVSGAKTD